MRLDYVLGELEKDPENAMRKAPVLYQLAMGLIDLGVTLDFGRGCLQYFSLEQISRKYPHSFKAVLDHARAGYKKALELVEKDGGIAILEDESKHLTKEQDDILNVYKEALLSRHWLHFIWHSVKDLLPETAGSDPIEVAFDDTCKHIIEKANLHNASVIWKVREMFTRKEDPCIPFPLDHWWWYHLLEQHQAEVEIVLDEEADFREEMKTAELLRKLDAEERSRLECLKADTVWITPIYKTLDPDGKTDSDGTPATKEVTREEYERYIEEMKKKIP